MVKFSSFKLRAILAVILFLPMAGLFALGSSTWTAKASTNWSLASTWTAVGTSTSTYPGQTAGNTDIVVIPTTFAVTLDVNVATNSVTSVTATGTGTLAMGANSL